MFNTPLARAKTVLPPPRTPQILPLKAQHIYSQPKMIDGFWSLAALRVVEACSHLLLRCLMLSTAGFPFQPKFFYLGLYFLHTDKWWKNISS